MRKCPYCSHEINDYKITCPNCGNKIQPISSSTPLSLYVILGVIALCLIGVFIINSKGSEAGRVIATRESAPKRIGMILCDDCEAIGMNISVWKEPSSNRELAFAVPNRTYATILGEKCDGSICYFKIEVKEYGTGWITKQFIPKIN